MDGNRFRDQGIFFTTRCRVIACWVYQRQLPYILLPATYKINCPKTRQRLLPIQAAIANCLLEAPGRSSCREKNTLTPELMESGTFQQRFKQFAGVCRSAEFGVKYAMGSIVIDSDTYKIGCSDFAEFFMKGKITVWKHRKGNVVGFFKILYLKCGVSDANTDHLYFAT